MAPSNIGLAVIAAALAAGADLRDLVAPSAIELAAIRAALVALAALAAGALVARAGAAGSPGRLALLLAPLLVPPVLVGYAYSAFGLPGVQHAAVREAVYAALLALRWMPLAALILAASPPGQTPAARHCHRLLAPPRARRLVFALRSAGPGPAVALALVFLLGFGELDLATLLGVRHWTVGLFDAHAGGLALERSLALMLGPGLIQLAAVATALALIVRHPGPVQPEIERGPGRAVRAAAAALVACAVLLVVVLPLGLVLHDAGRELAGVWRRPGLARELAASTLFAGSAALAAWCLAAPPRHTTALPAAWPGAPAMPGSEDPPSAATGSAAAQYTAGRPSAPVGPAAARRAVDRLSAPAGPAAEAPRTADPPSAPAWPAAEPRTADPMSAPADPAAEPRTADPMSAPADPAAARRTTAPPPAAPAWPAAVPRMADPLSAPSGPAAPQRASWPAALAACSRAAARSGTLALAPLGLLGPLVLSLVLLALLQTAPLYPLADTPLPLVLALTLLVLPHALLLRRLAGRLVPREPLHLVRLLEAGVPGRSRALARLRWTLAGRAEAGVAAVLFWLAWFDPTAASILAPAELTPAPVRLLDLMHYGRTAALSALVLATTALPLLLLGAAALLSRRVLGRGQSPDVTHRGGC